MPQLSSGPLGLFGIEQFCIGVILKNPHKDLRDYLLKLIDSLLYIKSLDEQLKIIKSWEDRRRVDALKIGSRFFSLVTYSFYRTILIELYKLLYVTEDRSIIDFLSTLREYVPGVSPKRYNPRTESRETINPKVYQSAIQRHLRYFQSKSDVIARIKGYRDKVIAHSDKEYFIDPLVILKAYHLTNIEIDELLSAVTRILRFHHTYMFDSDIDLRVHSSSNVDSILVYVRAYDRIWHDKKLNNIKKYVYKLDDYQQSET